MPAMHISLVPTLHGVPSRAASPHGTITLSSVSVQYSSHGSATIKQHDIHSSVLFVRSNGVSIDSYIDQIDIFDVMIYKDKILFHFLKNRSLTLIEIRQPRIIFSFVLFVVVITALDRSEAGRALWAWIGIADFVTASLADAKLPAVRRLRMIAFTLHDRDSCPAAPRTLAPRAPLAPSSVDLTWSVHDRHAFLVLTPLQRCFSGRQKIL